VAAPVATCPKTRCMVNRRYQDAFVHAAGYFDGMTRRHANLRLARAGTWRCEKPVNLGEGRIRGGSADFATTLGVFSRREPLPPGAPVHPTYAITTDRRGRSTEKWKLGRITLEDNRVYRLRTHGQEGAAAG